jgi:hypothetical protein
MRSTITLCFAIAVCLVGCGDPEARPTDSTASDAGLDTSEVVNANPTLGLDTAVVTGDTLPVKVRVDSIEKYETDHPEATILFAKVPGKDELVFVKDTASWPEEVEDSYVAIVDSSGNVLKHTVAPHSESGDWFMTEIHYFGANGRTILHRFHISSFSECDGSGAMLREYKDTFMGSTGATIAERREYRDRDDRPRDARQCFRRGDDAPDPKPSIRELPMLRDLRRP